MKMPWQKSNVERLQQLLESKEGLELLEGKSFDQLPYGIWQELVSATDMGATLGPEQAIGAPAILSVIRFISQAVGLIPFNVLRDTDPSANIRERAVETWQWNLLNRRPAPPPVTPFNLKADIAANFCGFGNAYLRKFKPTTVVPRFSGQTPRVTELMSLHGGSVSVKRAGADGQQSAPVPNGAIYFEDSTGTTNVARSTSDIIHIRSFSIDKDGLTGVSPITACRTFVSASLKRGQFDERHLTNGLFPGLAIEFPRGMSEEQAARWLDVIDQKHKGSGKAGKAIGYPNGANVTPLQISLQDALFADMTRLTMEQACSLYQVPLIFFSTVIRRPITDDDYRHFTAFCLGPVLRATTEALIADDDLFKPGVDDDLLVKPDSSALIEMDPLKKAQIEHTKIQDGTLLVDEVRGDDGMPPLPPIPKDWQETPGMIPQITPVGAAPNPTVNTSGPPTPAPGEAY